MNRLYMNRKRKMQINEEALYRREANRLSMKRKQLCETNDETLCRRQSDRLAKKQKQEHVSSTIDNAICLFTSKVQYGPDV